METINDIIYELDGNPKTRALAKRIELARINDEQRWRKDIADTRRLTAERMMEGIELAEKVRSSDCIARCNTETTTRDNNAKLREALVAVKKAIVSGIIGAVGNYPDEATRIRVANITDKIDAALSAPPEPIGNGAKTREVLKSASERLRKATESETFGEDVQYLVGCMRSVAQECDDALAEPPRNCDRRPTPPDAMLAHLAEVYEGEKVEFGDYEWSEFVKWLYAIAEGGAE